MATSRGWIADGFILKICHNRENKGSDFAHEKTSSKVKATISVIALERCQPCGQQICRVTMSCGAEISVISNEAVYRRDRRSLPTTAPCVHTECWPDGIWPLSRTQRTCFKRNVTMLEDSGVWINLKSSHIFHGEMASVKDVYFSQRILISKIFNSMVIKLDIHKKIRRSKILIKLLEDEIKKLSTSSKKSHLVGWQWDLGICILNKYPWLTMM